MHRPEPSEAARPPYNEVKTTQAAAMLLKLHGGQMSYMKLIKLLYNIDREALRRWGRPVTYDEVYSLPHGLVLSITLDKAETSDPVSRTYWDEFITTKGYYTQLIKECSDSELSDAEASLIEELADKYRWKDQFFMEREHHDPELFPEWEDPGQSRIHTSYEKILRALGLSEEESRKVCDELAEDAKIDELIHSQ